MTWISGIYLHHYNTSEKNGTLVGFDADFGEMYAYKGKFVDFHSLPKKLQKKIKTQ